ncbi:MAG: ATP-dependent DNA helicase Rep [Acidobacteria bacterium]|nr:ATP-dependent DNA helicase Rep [Acidobacteriota bacterium]
MDFLAGLNPQQREAVVTVDGPLLILAGAGSGKTRVITHRMAHLIQDRGIPGYAILAVTFTNKAAGEMKERVLGLLGGARSSAPNVSTFHSFCVRLLRRDGVNLAQLRPGFTTAFTIYDHDEQMAVIKQTYRALGLDDKFMQPSAALSRISHGKNQKETPQDFYKNAKDPKMSRLAVVFEQYEARLRTNNALDFDDLLLESVRLLLHDDAVRMNWNQRVEYLLIDEYQDTNRSQYELMRLLAGARHNVCVVGDEDQSIYGWRGANIRNILDFEKDFRGAKVIRLEQNYRSTKNILDGASAVVARNTERMGKWLWTEADAGERIGLYEAWDAENEALFIADTIDRLLSANPKQQVAVLYRTNFQSRQIEEALRRYGRAYSVVGGFSFYQRAEIKDILAYLKLTLSPNDSMAFSRIINTPARGIGKTTLEGVEIFSNTNNISMWDAMCRMLDANQLPARAQAALSGFRRMMEEARQELAGQPVHDILGNLLERTGYRAMLKEDPSPEAEARLQNLEELLNAASEADERGETPVTFLDHAALVAEADSVDDVASISLLTIHNAKGLEFPVVFLCGMEENLFPHSRSLASESLIEEERRLCYVGMTRARRRLYLSWARQRRRYGGGPAEASMPSRFLAEVPTKLLEPLTPGRQTPQVDLYAERHHVQEAARRNSFTGKTYNSLENISQFFNDRGVAAPAPARKDPNPFPVARPAAAAPAAAAAKPAVAAPAAASSPARKTRGSRVGAVVRHPKYGRGTILRKEGDGADAKLTINFPGHGLKKLFEKFAGLTIEE